LFDEQRFCFFAFVFAFLEPDLSGPTFGVGETHHDRDSVTVSGSVCSLFTTPPNMGKPNLRAGPSLASQMLSPISAPSFYKLLAPE
jgi:hypothetical protein